MEQESTQPFRDLIGARLASMTFVLNDYVQFHFDGGTLNAYEWPIVHNKGGVWKWGDAGYRDALCDRITATLANASVAEGDAMRLAMSDGAEIVVPLRTDHPGFDIAELFVDEPFGHWLWCDKRPIDSSQLVE